MFFQRLLFNQSCRLDNVFLQATGVPLQLIVWDPLMMGCDFGFRGFSEMGAISLRCSTEELMVGREGGRVPSRNRPLADKGG